MEACIRSEWLSSDEEWWCSPFSPSEANPLGCEVGWPKRESGEVTEPPNEVDWLLLPNPSDSAELSAPAPASWWRDWLGVDASAKVEELAVSSRSI